MSGGQVVESIAINLRSRILLQESLEGLWAVRAVDLLDDRGLEGEVEALEGLGVGELGQGGVRSVTFFSSFEATSWRRTSSRKSVEETLFLAASSRAGRGSGRAAGDGGCLGYGRGSAVDALVGHRRDPMEKLGVEIIQARKLLPPEEPFHVLDARFHLALGLGPVRPVRRRTVSWTP